MISSNESLVSTPAIAAAKWHILVCEDDEILVTMLRFRLSREMNADIVKVTDGRAAIEAVRKHRFDLIITDLYMPYYSGLEVVGVVRNQLNLSTPIILLTADRMEVTIQKAEEMGVNEVLTKPFNPAELTTCIKNLIAI